ncbi:MULTISPECIES: hypothetical protein [unclassified Nonomuraea]|uniref:hypothetical protein n=1 Tax=unclassified Nonomuraea TaxID=2593643 RepID=UPI001F15C730|nr:MULTISPECIES: hypothetical protein [unclassified Nonomuraea]
MAFSQDKGRHRRGRWWRRGSYLFSRRGEAPPDSERSFWRNARERRREARAAAKAREVTDRRRPAGGGKLGGRQERPSWPGAEQPERRTWPGADQPDSRPWPGSERPERSTWPGAERPERSTWPTGEAGTPPGRRERQVTWDAFAVRERRARLPAAVAERPAYTWYDFELNDEPPRAQPNRPDQPSMGDGLRHCGSLERILHRQWDVRRGPPSPEVVHAVESLARLPDGLKDKLAAGLEGVYVGGGGVPDLDDMGYLRGAPLPSGRATWDICAGAYGDRKIVVGDRPSPTPDVMMHEVGHAIDDVDSAHGEWVSDSPEFVELYETAMPVLASMFHRQGGGLGRKEFFADAFAAIASRQRPALVDMLGGDTRMALDVMLFFNRRYGI